MICPNCNNEIDNNASFCSYCGKKVEHIKLSFDSNERLVAARCPSCGANIQLDSSRETGFCQYCGASILIEPLVKKIKIDRTDELDAHIEMAYRVWHSPYIEKDSLSQEEQRLIAATSYYQKAAAIDPNNPKVLELEAAIFERRKEIARQVREDGYRIGNAIGRTIFIIVSIIGIIILIITFTQ